jgi:hypothetical protein
VGLRPQTGRRGPGDHRHRLPGHLLIERANDGEALGMPPPSNSLIYTNGANIEQGGELLIHSRRLDAGASVMTTPFLRRNTAGFITTVGMHTATVT